MEGMEIFLGMKGSGGRGEGDAWGAGQQEGWSGLGQG